MATGCLQGMPRACVHATLNFESSLHANEVGFRRPIAKQWATGAGRKKRDTDEGVSATFPAPLVLPGDDLSCDTRCPPQSLLSWVREKERNDVTSERNVLYLVGPPDTEPEMSCVHAWSNPQAQGSADGSSSSIESTDTPAPNVGHVLEYLRAFYHGINVQMLPAGLHFTLWDDADPNLSNFEANPHAVKYIGLNTSSEIIGIRTRPSKDCLFTGQLNLDDLLETAISILPNDAYALLILTEHDIFEDEDDEFCCGKFSERAFPI